MKKRFFADDEGRIFSLEFLKREWKDSEDSRSFGEYIAACMSYNGGTLKEISAEDSQDILVGTYYYTDGKYGPCQHKGREYTEYLYNLKTGTENGNEIDWNGVNHVLINEDDNRIFQASGYSFDRGMFCDLY